MTTIYLIRHGQASFHAAEYDQLSETGYEQGRILGRWFASMQRTPDRVVTGSMKRHRQTAESCLESVPGAPPADEWGCDPDFNEYDHREVLAKHRPAAGEASNLQSAFRDYWLASFARWQSGEHDADYDEPWPVFRDRCVRALQTLASRMNKGETAWVFTSGGVISTLTQFLLAVPDDRVMDLNWRLANTGVSRVDVRPGNLYLHTLNDFSHLQAQSRPELITYK